MQGAVRTDRTVDLGLLDLVSRVSAKWILRELISTCSFRPLPAGPISEQFRDLEVCSEISPAGRVSQAQVEKYSRKKETAVTGPLAAGQPARACMQNSEFMHA